MFDEEITVLQNENSTYVMNLNEEGKNINFANVNLDKNIYRTVEETEGYSTLIQY